MNKNVIHEVRICEMFLAYCLNTFNLNEISTFHQENMSVKCVPRQTPHLYSKTGVCRGIPIFLIFALTCTRNLCFEQK